MTVADFPVLATWTLVVVAVVLAIAPKLVDKFGEKHRRLRNILALVCVGIGAAGFFADRNQRRDDNHKRDNMSRNVDSLVTNTTNTLSTFQSLVPEITNLHSDIADLKRRIDAAGARGDPAMVAKLTDEMAAAQEKADAASRQVLLSMVPSVAEQLRILGQRWYDEDDQVLTLSPASVRDARRLEVARRYLLQAKPLLENADRVRQQLLDELLPSSLIPHDQQVADVFRRALAGEIYPRESLALRDTAAIYLNDLANRVQSYATYGKVAKLSANYSTAEKEHKKSEAAGYLTKLVQVAPEITLRIITQGGDCGYRITIDQRSLNIAHNPSPGRTERVNDAQQELNNQNAQCRAALEFSMKSADLMRAALLHDTKLTERDQREAKIFADYIGGKEVSYFDVKDAGRYLEELARKVDPNFPLTPPQ
jgi:hypothetical protein